MIAPAKKFILVLKTTYKKVILKYQVNTRFPSLWLTSGNAIFGSGRRKKKSQQAHRGVHNLPWVSHHHHHFHAANSYSCPHCVCDSQTVSRLICLRTKSEAFISDEPDAFLRLIRRETLVRRSRLQPLRANVAISMRSTRKIC